MTDVPSLDTSSRAISVTLVDDEQAALDVVSRSLTSTSDRAFDVHTTTDPSEALAAVEAGGVDCIVSDYEMPEMDGLELLERVRETEPELPFILYTARGGEEIASRAITAGVTDYLQKNFSREQFDLLANRVENAVSHYWMVQQRQRRETLLSDIVTNISESVYVANGDYEMLYISDAIEDIYGLPKEALTENPLAFLEYVPPEDRDRVEEWVGELETAGRTGDWDDEYQVEYRFDHPEKGRRWIRATLYPILDEDGEYDRGVGTAADVTEEKAYLSRLEGSEAKFRSIAELSTDLIFRIDVDGNLTYLSPAVEDIAGYESEAVRGEEFIEFIEDPPRETATEEFQQVLSGEVRNGIELGVRHADGRSITLEVNAAPIRQAGEIVGAQGVARDITERKARERELEQYETIVETVPDGVFVIDEQGRVVVANERAAEMAGLEDRHDDIPSEPMHKMDEDGVASDEAVEKYLSAVRELLDSGAERTMYRLVTTVDGEQRAFEIHLALRPHGDGYRGTVGIIRDITERQQYERELERQNDRLEQVASTISHDLRNPLNVAAARLQMMEVEDGTHHLRTVEAAHERMNDLIDDILSLARQGQPVSDPERVSLADTAEQAWSTVETGDAELTVQDGVEPVLADESRLRQLLENLFRNSVEHGSTGSRPEADDAVEHGGEGVSVTVGPLAEADGFFLADDGPGIPPADRELVFEQGYSTADSTGFGLSIVQQIAEAHNWGIALTESADGGARFEFRVSSHSTRGDRSAR